MGRGRGINHVRGTNHPRFTRFEESRHVTGTHQESHQRNTCLSNQSLWAAAADTHARLPENKRVNVTYSHSIVRTHTKSSSSQSATSPSSPPLARYLTVPPPKVEIKSPTLQFYCAIIVLFYMDGRSEYHSNSRVTNFCVPGTTGNIRTAPGTRGIVCQPILFSGHWMSK